MRTALALWGLLVVPACTDRPDAHRPEAGARRLWFEDVTAASGVDFVNVCGSPGKEYILDSLGAGVALFDADGDGDLELYFAQGSTLEHALAGTNPHSDRLYRNDGGFRFQDVTGQAGIDERGWSHGVAAGDVDGDADLDLFVANWGADTLYRNRGDGGFADDSAAAGVADDRWSTSAAFADPDLDGDLDLYVANYVRFDPSRPPPPGAGWKGVPSYTGPQGLVAEPDWLYQNDGTGVFHDVAEAAGIRAAPNAYALAVLWFDYDRDGDPDLYVANDTMPNHLFRNDGGRFTEIGVLAGVAYNSDGAAQAGMGVACGDADGDDQADLFVTNFAFDFNTLYRGLGAGQWDPSAARGDLRSASFHFMGWGVVFADLDADQDQDLALVNGHLYPAVDASPSLRDVSPYRQPRQLFLNDGGAYRDLGASAGPGFADPRCGRGLAAGDLDDDGDLDLVATNIDDRPVLLRNDSPHGHWLRVRLDQAGGNRFALGARVEVTAGGRTQAREVRSGSSYLCESDLRVHFGLGAATSADVRVFWPGGAIEEHRGVAADRELVLRREVP